MGVTKGDTRSLDLLGIRNTLQISATLDPWETSLTPMLNNPWVTTSG